MTLGTLSPAAAWVLSRALPADDKALLLIVCAYGQEIGGVHHLCCTQEEMADLVDMTARSLRRKTPKIRGLSFTKGCGPNTTGVWRADLNALRGVPPLELLSVLPLRNGGHFVRRSLQTPEKLSGVAREHWPNCPVLSHSDLTTPDNLSGVYEESRPNCPVFTGVLCQTPEKLSGVARKRRTDCPVFDATPAKLSGVAYNRNARVGAHASAHASSSSSDTYKEIFFEEEGGQGAEPPSGAVEGSESTTAAPAPWDGQPHPADLYAEPEPAQQPESPPPAPALPLASRAPSVGNSGDEIPILQVAPWQIAKAGEIAAWSPSEQIKALEGLMTSVGLDPASHYQVRERWLLTPRTSKRPLKAVLWSLMRAAEELPRVAEGGKLPPKEAKALIRLADRWLTYAKPSEYDPQDDAAGQAPRRGGRQSFPLSGFNDRVHGVAAQLPCPTEMRSDAPEDWMEGVS